MRTLMGVASLFTIISLISVWICLGLGDSEKVRLAGGISVMVLLVSSVLVILSLAAIGLVAVVFGE